MSANPMAHMMQVLEENIHFLTMEAETYNTNNSNLTSPQRRYPRPAVDTTVDSSLRMPVPETLRPPPSTAIHAHLVLVQELESIGVLGDIDAKDRVEAAKLWKNAEPWLQTLMDRSRQRLSIQQLRILCGRVAEAEEHSVSSIHEDGEGGHVPSTTGGPTYITIVDNVKQLRRQLSASKRRNTPPPSHRGANVDSPPETQLEDKGNLDRHQDARIWSITFLDNIQKKGIAGCEFVRMTVDDKTKLFNEMQTPRSQRSAIAFYVPMLL
eukprot:PhF_6_TR18692/c0_g1_i1/m.27321